MCLAGFLGGLDGFMHVKSVEPGPVNGSYCYFVKILLKKMLIFMDSCSQESAVWTHLLHDPHVALQLLL